jgi:hypothetical protein
MVSDVSGGLLSSNPEQQLEGLESREQQESPQSQREEASAPEVPVASQAQGLDVMEDMSQTDDEDLLPSPTPSELLYFSQPSPLLLPSPIAALTSPGPAETIPSPQDQTEMEVLSSLPGSPLDEKMALLPSVESVSLPGDIMEEEIAPPGFPCVGGNGSARPSRVNVLARGFDEGDRSSKVTYSRGRGSVQAGGRKISSESGRV